MLGTDWTDDKELLSVGSVNVPIAEGVCESVMADDRVGL